MPNQDLHAPELQEKDVNLLDILAVILKHKKLIVSISGLTTIVVGFASFLTPNVYTATATILPIEKNSGPNLSALIGSMGGEFGAFKSQIGLGGGKAADTFVTVMQTRTLTESIITKMNLMPVLFDNKWDEKSRKWKTSWFDRRENPENIAPSMQDAVELMRQYTSISKNKSNEVISVSYSSSNPKLSAEIANYYIKELDNYLKNNALSTAKRNRLFIENQLNNTKVELAEFEIALKNFQQHNQVVSLDVQAEATVKTYAELKAKLIASEVELKLVEQSTIAGDPRASLKRQEIAEIKRQLQKFEDGSRTGPLVSFRNAPSLGLDLARLKRELMVRQKVFELLTQQFEMAKIQEAQDDISFQILDVAIPPEKKSGPKRLANIVISFFASLAFATSLAFIIELWRNNKSDFHYLLASNRNP